MAVPPRPKAPEQDTGRVVLGEIAGAHGVRGAVKVISWTRPRRNIFDYAVWHLDNGTDLQTMQVKNGREQGKGLVAELAEINDRDSALALRGSAITVERSALPATAEGEYYWADLQGLAVETTTGQPLGTVTGLIETGANDVLVVNGDRERLIPYVPEEFVQSVDLASGRMVVDWDPEF